MAAVAKSHEGASAHDHRASIKLRAPLTHMTIFEHVLNVTTATRKFLSRTLSEGSSTGREKPSELSTSESVDSSMIRSHERAMRQRKLSGERERRLSSSNKGKQAPLTSKNYAARDRMLLWKSMLLIERE